jgi:hypothetical protein
MEPRRSYRGKSLITLLSHFTTADRQAFRRFIYSPFFNNRLSPGAVVEDPRILLFEAIDRRWQEIFDVEQNGVETQPLASLVYPDVFGTEVSYDLQRFSRIVMSLEEMIILYSGLPNHAERYRSVREGYNQFHLEFYRDRGMHAEFNEARDRILSDQEIKSGNESREDYLTNYQVQLECYRYQQKYEARAGLNLMPLLDALQAFNGASFLEHYTILLLQQNNTPLDLKPLQKKADEYLEENASTGNLWNKLHIESIRLLRQLSEQDVSIESYKKFIALLENLSGQLTSEQYYLFYGISRNYCAVAFNLGHDVFLKHLYLTYQKERGSLYHVMPGRRLSINQFYPMCRIYFRYGLSVRLFEMKGGSGNSIEESSAIIWDKIMKEIDKVAPVQKIQDSKGNYSYEFIKKQIRVDGPEVEGMLWLIRAEIYNCLQDTASCRHCLDKLQQFPEVRRTPIYGLTYATIRCRSVYDDIVQKIKIEKLKSGEQTATLRNIEDNLRHTIEDLTTREFLSSALTSYQYFANHIKSLAAVLIKIQFAVQSGSEELNHLPYVKRRVYTYEVMTEQLANLTKKVNDNRYRPADREWLRLRIAELQQWLADLKTTGVLADLD